VLAAEYLGVLGVGSAAGKLTALTAPGNPLRLRHAAIDALGEVGRAHHLPAAGANDAIRALVDVLREGPGDLHASAATSLSYIASPAALASLIVLARSDRGPTRCEIVRAIGATLRGQSGQPGQPDPAARQLLRALVDDASIKVGLAAIASLAAAHSLDDAPLLRTLVDQAAADRRRAAAWALGEIHDAGSIDALAAALSSKDDRLAGDAAWALGEILAGRSPDGKPPVALPGDPRAGAIVDRWLHVVQRGGWAAAINSAAGLARVLWMLPTPARAELLTRPRRESLLARSFHKSRLVRINLALALAALGDDDAVKQLAQLVKDDPSPHVRVAAVRALQRIGGPKATAALRSATTTAAATAGDDDPAAPDAAKAAAAAPVGPPPPRTEWRTFYVVDPSAGDARVRQEQYFVHTVDDLVWASYTDARGELTTEHIPAETARDSISPASRESEY
jgi:HEAT repeat protein